MVNGSTSQQITGYVRNISFNKQKHRPFLGWYLIVTETGEEYLVRRDLSITSNWYRQVFQPTISLVDYIISDDEYHQFFKNDFRGLGFGMILAAAMRSVFPLNFWFGRVNIRFNIYQGLANILYVMAVFLIVVQVISLVRKKKLAASLKKLGGDMIFVGKLKRSHR